MEAQFNNAGQALNQQTEVDFDLTHSEVGIQRLQAFPHNPMTIKPEWGLAQTGLHLHQQVGVLTLSETVLIGLELVGGQPAQSGNLLGAALRQGVDGHPHQRTIEAQRPHIRGFLP